MGPPMRRYLPLLASGTVVVVVACLGLSMISPSSEAARVRNSLLASPGTATDFAWTPESRPAGFLQETAELGEFGRIASELGTNSNAVGDVERAVALARHLAIRGPFPGDPIQSDTLTAYQTIVGQGLGYCSDFTQVFNALTYASGIPVREWGMAFDGFGGWGHAFNEIYDRELEQWVFIDPFNSFYLRDAATDRPLSAMEFRDRLSRADAAQSIRVVPIERKAFGFRDEAQMFEYYTRGRDQFYLWWGNNVITYDANALVRTGHLASRSAEQVLGIVAGVQPKIKVLMSESNREMFDRLIAVKREFIALAILGFISALVFVWQGWKVLMLRHRT